MSTPAPPTVSGSNRLLDVEKLENDGKNYSSWVFRIQLVLKLRELWGQIEGSNSTPPNPVTDEWFAKDQKAYTQIALTLSDDPLNTIYDTTTAKDAWNALADRYRGKGIQSAGYLLTKLWQTRMTVDIGMEDQINEKRTIARQLGGLGFPLEDKVLAMAIVISLPPEYRIVQSIASATATGSNDLDTKTISAQILAEEQRQREAGESNQSALYTRAGKPGKSKAATPKKGDAKPKCQNCKKTGHTIEKCWAPGGGAEGQGPKKGTLAKPKDEKAKVAAEEKIVEVFMAEVTVSALVADNLKTSSRNSTWIIDSGASAHMSCRRHFYSTYEKINPPRRVWMGNNQYIEAIGIGTIGVTLDIGGGKSAEAVFTKVLHVPELNGNLLSVPELTFGGLSTLFRSDLCVISNKNGKTVGRAKKSSGLYILDVKVHMDERAYITTIEKSSTPNESQQPRHSTMAHADMDTWHRRLGHISVDSVLKMVKDGMVNGMSIVGGKALSALCVPCQKGAQTRKPIPSKTETRSSEVLGRVFSDLCGKIDPPTREGFQYFITFTDDASRYSLIRFLKLKSDALTNFKEMVAEAETQTGKNIKILRSDGGGEYVSGDFKAYLKSKGIIHEMTNAYTPPENGVAERLNRTLVERARKMMADANLGKSTWMYAIRHAAYLRNLSPTRSLSNNLTPYEAWTGNKPSVSTLRIFGCKAYMHIPDKHRVKLDPKSLECVHLGYSLNKKAYILWDSKTKKIHESRDVNFDEGSGTVERVQVRTGDESNDKYDTSVGDNDKDTPRNSDSSDDNDDDGNNDDLPPLFPLPHLSPVRRQTEEEDPDVPADENVHPDPPEPRRSGRRIIAPERADHPRYSVSSYARDPDLRRNVPLSSTAEEPQGETANIATDSTDPRTYKEAMSLPDSELWKIAIANELASMSKTEAFEETERPDNRKIVGSRWVFTKKRGADGRVERYKARLVAQGFTQVEGIDYEETFAPVVKWPSIRILLALAADLDLEVDHMDVVTAFLNGVLKEEVYLEPPEGYQTSRPGMVLRLRKSLYGLKQSPRSWYEKAKTELNELGFRNCPSDSAVFIKIVDEYAIIIALYVDDLMLLTSHKPLMLEVKEELKKRFDMKDLGPINFFLGMQISRDRPRRLLDISQHRYINDILDRFGLSESRPVSTPIQPHLQLAKLDAPVTQVKDYQARIGSLMYLMLGTRPDLAFSVGALSQFSTAPGPDHVTAVTRVFKYLNKTKDIRLVYGSNSREKGLVGYSDADWAGDANDRRSVSGYTFILNSGAVSWSSKKQTSIALSSTEAEYISSSEATKEAIWIRRFLLDIGHPQTLATTILIDNQAAIAIARNPTFHARTKHIEIRYHFIREKLESGEIDVEYVPTDDQIADILTKGLARQKHEYFSTEIGLVGFGTR